MKLFMFIINLINKDNLQPFKPFFFEGIKDNRISIYNDTLNNYSELGQVKDWLNAEINRNPFRIEKGVVVLLIPRNLRGGLTVSDYDFYSRIYVYEHIAKHFDNRFNFVCIFIDEIDNMSNDCSAYNEISRVREYLKSDNGDLDDYLLLNNIKNDDLSISAFYNALEKISDSTVKSFYSEVLDNTGVREMNDTKSVSDVLSGFKNCCKRKISDIRFLYAPYYGGDISEKIETNFKITYFLRDIAYEKGEIPTFGEEDEYKNRSFFTNYTIDMPELKALIVTYKKRLNNWLDSNIPTSPEMGPYEEFEFDEDFKKLEEYKLLKEYIENTSLSFKITVKDAEENNVTDMLFEKIKENVSEAEQRVYSFADAVVKKAEKWRLNHKARYIEKSLKGELSNEEIAQEREAEKQLNIYSSSEMPSYSETNGILQSLDDMDARFKLICAKIKAHKIGLYMITLAFAILSVAAFYLGIQYSVFVKEATWIVYIIYIAVIAVLFIPVYLRVLLSYYKEFRKLLKECQLRLDAFFKSYLIMADNFSDNMTNSLKYYCLESHLNEISAINEEEKLRIERYEWHRPRMESILNDLALFDSFVLGTNYIEEQNVPELTALDDAAHSEFYQMKIFK